MTSTTRQPQDKICAYEYTVKRGDSFYLIAHRLGVPLRDLLEANSTINPARLMVGDVLCIPMRRMTRRLKPLRPPLNRTFPSRQSLISATNRTIWINPLTLIPPAWIPTWPYVPTPCAAPCSRVKPSPTSSWKQT